MKDELVIRQTEKWIKTVVVDLNFCPFAAKVLFQKSIRYNVIQGKAGHPLVLDTLLDEWQYLDANPNIETSFLILNESFENFADYLQLIKKAERFLEKNNYDGIYQLASFHPDYFFSGSHEDDPANYTNRSPYPMIHLIREESLAKALSVYPHPEKIPDNNITLAHQKGLHYMQLLRLACFEL